MNSFVLAIDTCSGRELRLFHALPFNFSIHHLQSTLPLFIKIPRHFLSPLSQSSFCFVLSHLAILFSLIFPSLRMFSHHCQLVRTRGVNYLWFLCKIHHQFYFSRINSFLNSCDFCWFLHSSTFWVDFFDAFLWCMVFGLKN